MRTKIKEIVIDEFSIIAKKIENDFSKNFDRKANNFLLCQMTPRQIAYMVFVSSFESKSGTAVEKCAKRIAKLTYGEENVPTIVNPRNLTHYINPNTISGQIVITDVDTQNGNLHGEIASFRANNVAKGEEKSKVTHEKCQEVLLPLSNKYRTAQIYTKPVDLAFFDGTTWNIIELKAGGDLDSSNAPANVEKLLTIYVDMGIENCKAYFATLYNKDGEGRNWTGGIKKHLNYPSMFLIGSKFWEKILPESICFADFIGIYKEALEEINLNTRINNIINQTIGE